MIAPSVLPVPAGAERVLLFGGSFDPPHRAHMELPPLVRERLGMDWVVYVPAARSPHKQQSPGVCGADRAHMLELGIVPGAHASVWGYEIDRGGEVSAAARPSYTVDTVREALRQRPGLRLRLLIGADQARSFYRWREPSAIMRLAPPVVMRRPVPRGSPWGETESALVNDLGRFWPGEGGRRWASWIVEVPEIAVSATRVRELLLEWGGRGEPMAELAEMVPLPVLAYIRDRGLYGVSR